MSELSERMNGAVEAIRVHTRHEARVGIVLGTGLGALAKEVQADKRVPLAQVPGIARATVQGHGSELIAGKLGGTPVFVLDGRLHFYEGHNLGDVVFPVRLLKALGCDTVILSNACGGLNPDFELGARDGSQRGGRRRMVTRVFPRRAELLHRQLGHGHGLLSRRARHHARHPRSVA
jgi:purine-nucleoside phosphorylase